VRAGDGWGFVAFARPVGPGGSFAVTRPAVDGAVGWVAAGVGVRAPSMTLRGGDGMNLPGQALAGSVLGSWGMGSDLRLTGGSDRGVGESLCSGERNRVG
jgi:hypothetical protein